MSTLNTLLEDSAARFGPSPALLFNPGYRTRIWTYRQLLADSQTVADWLAGRGVRSGDRVILWANNSPYWAVAMFGILRAGAVAVPLDVRSDRAFVDRVISQTEPVLALLSGAIARDWNRPIPALEVESLDFAARAVAPPERPPAVGPDDVAEIVFTSGTTGDPKGVVLTHANIRANVEAIDRIIPSGPDHSVISILPLSHMLEQTAGLFLPLSGGASIYYPASRQSTAIFRALREHPATMLLLVPQALQLFMDAIDREVARQGSERQWRLLSRAAAGLPMWVRRVLFRRVHRRLGGRLRFIVTGGARLEPDLAERWERLGFPVVQGYGATEASPVIASSPVADRKHPAVGRPLAGVEVRLAPDSEIMVRGPNVARGYWHNPEATAAAFRDGWYHTGDLGSLDARSALHLHGRKKDMIALPNGQNVYPEDVERALLQAPGVRAAAVIPLPTERGPEVHGVVIPDAAGPSPETIARDANSRLAPHQRVRSVTVWPDDDFPLSFSLKVKRHEVLARVQELRAGDRTEPAPTPGSESEEDPLRNLIARVTGIRENDVLPESTLSDDLGLDSLATVELLAAIESEFGVYIDESSVGPETTVANLHTLLAARDGRARPTFPRWPVSRPAHAVRRLLQPPAFAAFSVLAPTRIPGAGHLATLPAPVVFAANHSSHLDTPVVLNALPARVRRTVAVAAAADYFFANRALGSAASLLLNAFPFSRETAVRPTLEHCGWLLDRGWSILLFPEGTRSTTGEMAPFKAGVGLLAVELAAPIVPVRIRGAFDMLPKGRAVPRPGRVAVAFGSPITFDRDTPYETAASLIEQAVRDL